MAESAEGFEDFGDVGGLGAEGFTAVKGRFLMNLPVRAVPEACLVAQKTLYQ